MISNAATTDLFATWTTDFDVQVDLPLRTLTFRPALKDGRSLRPRSLFARPGKGESSYQTLIGEFLSLRSESPAQAWARTAARLGPLFAHHPLHHAAVGSPLTESLEAWITARDALATVWSDIHALAMASATPLTPEERRQVGLDNLMAAGLGVPADALPPAQLDPLLEAYMPSTTQTDQLGMLESIGAGLNRWFLDPHPRLVPLLNPTTLQVEIVVPQGIQALLLMTVALAREDMTAFPNRCARPGCTAVAFMKGRRIYCSTPCQTAHKAARYRQRAAQRKRTPPA